MWLCSYLNECWPRISFFHFKASDAIVRRMSTITRPLDHLHSRVVVPFIIRAETLIMYFIAYCLGVHNHKVELCTFWECCFFLLYSNTLTCNTRYGYFRVYEYLLFSYVNAFYLLYIKLDLIWILIIASVCTVLLNWVVSRVRWHFVSLRICFSVALKVLNHFGLRIVLCFREANYS